jgi:hypothetical protein
MIVRGWYEAESKSAYAIELVARETAFIYFPYDIPTLNVGRVRWDTRKSVGEALDETRILLGVILSERGLKRPVLVSTLRNTSRYLPARGNEAERWPSSSDRSTTARRAPVPPTGIA